MMIVTTMINDHDHDDDNDNDDNDNDGGDTIIKGKWADSLYDSMVTPDGNDGNDGDSNGDDYDDDESEMGRQSL